MVRHPLVPPAERRPGSFPYDGLSVIVSSKAADGVQGGEPRDGGEHDFFALVPAQKPGAAEAADCAQVFADLGFVVTLVAVSGRPRRPPAPYPRDHTVLISPG